MFHLTMSLLVVQLFLVVAKLASFGPIGDLSWWWVMIPALTPAVMIVAGIFEGIAMYLLFHLFSWLLGRFDSLFHDWQ